MRIPKIIIIACLLLIVFAYLPTLTNDYVATDQWRAFRYSVPAQTPFVRLTACWNTVREFYAFTGRPLIFWGECVEHALVENITDFKYLRPFVLVITLITAVYMGQVLGRFLPPVPAMIASSLFVLTPGYSFMYLQGMTAVMLPIGILCAAYSFQKLTGHFDGTDGGRGGVPALLFAGLGFLAACLIYPMWAYIVFPLIMLRFAYAPDRHFAQRLREAGKTAAFYVAVSAVYYVLFCVPFIKINKQSLTSATHKIYHLGLQLNWESLYAKLGIVLHWVKNFSPLNIRFPEYSTAAILFLFSWAAGSKIAAKEGGLRSSVFKYACSVMFLGAVTLALSIAPWCLSSMDALPSRSLVAWHLFYCAALAVLAWELSGKVFYRSNLWPVAAVLLCLMVPSSMAQYKLSRMETAAYANEMGLVRDSLYNWMETEGYKDKKYLLFVLPPRPRPAFADGIGGLLNLGDNVVLATAQNPVCLPWMVTAALREAAGGPIEGNIVIRNCGNDLDCVRRYYQWSNIIIGTADGKACIRPSYNPFVINLSLLTNRPVMPAVGDQCPGP